MKKTILFVHKSAELYGSDRVLLALVTRLDKDHFHPIVVLPSTGPLVTELQKAGVEHHITSIGYLSRSRLTLPGLFRFSKNLIQSIGALDRLFAGRRIDIVQSNTLAVISGAIWAKLHHIPHIWHVHEIIQRPRIARKIYGYLLEHLSEQIVCVSQASKNNLLRDRPALMHKSIVIWNGLERSTMPSCNNVSRMRQRLGLEEGEVSIVLIGRVNRMKGQGVLVDAISSLWEKGIKNLKVHFVGGTVPGQEHYLQALRQRIADSPARQCFTIHPFEQNAWPFFDASDMVIVPSTEPESFGLVALEAMASSKPVVGANHGGIQEIIVDGMTGLLVNPNDEKSLAQAIEKLTNDANLRRSMGENGMQRYQALFTLSANVTGFEKVYEPLSP